MKISNGRSQLKARKYPLPPIQIGALTQVLMMVLRVALVEKYQYKAWFRDQSHQEYKVYQGDANAWTKYKVVWNDCTSGISFQCERYLLKWWHSCLFWQSGAVFANFLTSRGVHTYEIPICIKCTSTFFYGRINWICLIVPSLGDFSLFSNI